MPAHRYTTISDREINQRYTPDDVRDVDYARDLNDPGHYPCTRGIHPNGYLGKLWTMRQFAGFGSPEDTNRRYRQLLDAGGTGLSVAFDLPTLMGRDPGDPLAAGEVGRCGVSVASLADMEVLFDGIRVGDVTTSMTINAPAAMLVAMYLVVAERQGTGWGALSGTVQNDILKEFIAQKEFIFPPRPSMRLVTDVVTFCVDRVPRWNPLSVSGYHIREAGLTAVQELAFTLADGLEYVKWGLEAGLPVDRMAPRVSFFFNAHSDFFEEIAKYRAARRMWARLMRERFGAADERSWKLRFHTQTAGVSLTAQQPYTNVVRTALQALGAVLGGTNSLHTNALDEALALPTEDAARLALRTQQVLAHETGIVDVVDPLGGSWFLERLTSDMEAEASALLERIDALGGMVAAIEEGFPQREIADAAYRHQRAVESKERLIVGVNVHVEDRPETVPVLAIDEKTEARQLDRIAEVRRRRDAGAVERALDQLRVLAGGPSNVMPALLDATRAYATVGEMCDVLRSVWGEYEEIPSL